MEYFEIKAKMRTLKREAEEILDNAKKEKRVLKDNEVKKIEEITDHLSELDKQAELEEFLSQSNDPFYTGKKTLIGPNSSVMGASKGLAKMFRASVMGPRDEWEERALSTTDNKSGYTIDITLAKDVIQQARAKTVAGRAGVKFLEMGPDFKWPRITSGVAPAARAEAGNVAEVDETYGLVPAAPISLAGMLKVSVEVLQDGGELLERAIQADMLGAINNKIDNLFLNGTGADNEPTGLITLTNTSGTVALGSGAGGDVDWDDIITGAAAIRENNYGEFISVVMNPRTLAGLGKLKEATTDAYLKRPDYVSDMVIFDSSQVSKAKTVGGTTTCADLFIFDPNQFFIGIRSDIRLEVMKELYMGNLQYGFLVHARFDILTLNNYGVYTLTGITN